MECAGVPQVIAVPVGQEKWMQRGDERLTIDGLAGYGGETRLPEDGYLGHESRREKQEEDAEAKK